MDNPRLIDEEDIPMLHEDENDYDYKTSDTSRVDETSFIERDTTEATSTLQLRQKVKQDKITVFYRHLNVTGDPGLADIDRVVIKKNLKTGNTDFLFLDANKHWQPLINKSTSEFLAAKALKEKFGGLNTMKSALSLEKTPTALAKSLKAGLPTDLEMESIPLEKISSLVEDIDVETREASQNTDLNMRKVLGSIRIYKA